MQCIVCKYVDTSTYLKDGKNSCIWQSAAAAVDDMSTFVELSSRMFSCQVKKSEARKYACVVMSMRP